MIRLTALALLAVAGAVAPSTPSFAGGDDAATSPYISPYDAIWRAAADPVRGVKGTFKMAVKAWGTQDGIVYLNSEEDYRDQRSISIEILPDAQSGMTRKFGEPARLIGKTFLVAGTARRTKIIFAYKGQTNGKYYYQTHVAVTDARQIEILPQ